MDPQMINPELRELLLKVDAIKKVLSENESFNYAIKNFKRGDTIIKEDDINDSIFIILDGIVTLSKTQDYETEIQVDKLEPGDLLGLLSFWTGDTAFANAYAKTPVTTLCLARSDFDRLSITYPELNRLLQPMIITNLAKRYRRIVSLHLRVATLTRELENERNELREAYEKLEQTSNRLIHQEKMATLGQLVAGIAHEINNPTSSLVRSVENIIQYLPEVFKSSSNDAKDNEKIFNLGLNKSVISTEEQRNKMDKLSDTYPDLSRSIVRTLAQIDSNGFIIFEKELKKKNNEERIQNLLNVFEIGTFLKSIKVSSERISKLVKSLKSYSRQSLGQFELMDVRQGIEDTLLILGNRLKHYSFHINMPDIPKVNCLVDELNQVWTNIIINACDAMGNSGMLKIECGIEEPYYVWITFADTGPGIPDEAKKKIFEPNYTTKNVSGSFGLGLGLSISNEIILKHGGKIIVGDNPGGGALFKVLLPIAAQEL